MSLNKLLFYKIKKIVLKICSQKPFLKIVIKYVADRFNQILDFESISFHFHFNSNFFILFSII